MEKVGKEGVITVKEGKTIEDELEVTEGMRFDRGYISPYFVTNTKTGKVGLRTPSSCFPRRRFLLSRISFPLWSFPTSTAVLLLSLLRTLMARLSLPVFLTSSVARSRLLLSRPLALVTTERALLGDIAILTGGTVFTEELDIKPENASLELLGTSGSITITKDDTIVLNGEGSKENIVQRCEQIKSHINDSTTSEYEKEKLQERLAKLAGGVAVIKVGGSSEVEVGEKKDRYVDALNATRAAVEEGILPGGGTALLKASRILDSVKTENLPTRSLVLTLSALPSPSLPVPLLRTLVARALLLLASLLTSSVRSWTKGYNLLTVFTLT